MSLDLSGVARLPQRAWFHSITPGYDRLIHYPGGSMRRLLNGAAVLAIAVCAGAACTGQGDQKASGAVSDSGAGSVSAKPDAFFVSRKPVDGVAECVAWGWRNQADNRPAAAMVAANGQGQHILSEGSRERLELRPGPVNTEVSLYRLASGDDEAMDKRIAVLEACL